MIVAADSTGAVWLSLVQSNSNNQVFQLFLRYLSLKLDRDRPGWRENTVITLDGASYHKAAATRELMGKLRLPISMIGPYGYQAQTAELFFAAFKSDDFNPYHIATTKSEFDALVQLVVARCRKIPRHQLILHWHHSMLGAYRYLGFHRL